MRRQVPALFFIASRATVTDEKDHFSDHHWRTWTVSFIFLGSSSHSAGSKDRLNNLLFNAGCYAGAAS
jgi:hypothetical protein